jgi:hypothetical protein
MKSKASRSCSIIILTCFSSNSLFYRIYPSKEPCFWYSRTKYTKSSSSNTSSNLNKLSHSSRAQWTLISYIRFVAPLSILLRLFLSIIFIATRSNYSAASTIWFFLEDILLRTFLKWLGMLFILFISLLIFLKY